MKPIAVALLLTMVCLSVGCGPVSTEYPQRNVTIICPWAPGGGTDRLARFWADELHKEFGRAFMVVNKEGGSGNSGHTAGARARPDGHTLTLITFELSTMRYVQPTTISHEDYACILQMNADPAAIIVRDDAPWRSISEFLEDVKKKPGEIRMSGTAKGGVWDLARAGLLENAGIPPQAVNWVPETGSAPALTQLLGGHISAVCCSVPEARTQIEAEQLRALVVMADERLSNFPDIPTAKESGVPWVAEAWRGLAAPKGTPPEILETLQQRCLKIADSDSFKEFMKIHGFGVHIRDTEQFTEFLETQDEQWKPVIEMAGYARQ